MIERTLWAISIFGQKERKGLVQLRLEDKEVQMHVDDARDFAISILTAAEAAETDEFLMTFLSDKVGLKDDVSRVQVLKDFRDWRDKKRR